MPHALLPNVGVVILCMLGGGVTKVGYGLVYLVGTRWVIIVPAAKPNQGRMKIEWSGAGLGISQMDEILSKIKQKDITTLL